MAISNSRRDRKTTNKIRNPTMTPTYHEILNQINTSTKEQTIQILKSSNTNFQTFLKLAFDPTIKFYPKAFPPNYKTPDTLPGISYSNLNAELKRLYLFQIGNPTADSLTEEKRNILLLQLLESLEPEEATTLINLFNKNLKTKNLTYKLVKETFPNLLP